MLNKHDYSTYPLKKELEMIVSTVEEALVSEKLVTVVMDSALRAEALERQLKAAHVNCSNLTVASDELDVPRDSNVFILLSTQESEIDAKSFVISCDCQMPGTSLNIKCSRDNTEKACNPENEVPPKIENREEKPVNEVNGKTSSKYWLWMIVAVVITIAFIVRK